MRSSRLSRWVIAIGVTTLVAALATMAAVAQAPSPDDPLAVAQSGTDAGTPSYMLPWPAGYSWRKYYTWHATGYEGLGYTGLDFAPPADAPPEAYAVLAAAAGTLSELCGAAQGDYWQTSLRIDHATGFTLYLHIDATTVPRELIGRYVERGQYLGLLYRGQTGAGSNPCGAGECIYSTPCGSGTAVHLHFQFADESTLVDGYVPSDIAFSADGSEWLSHNTAVGYVVPTPARDATPRDQAATASVVLAPSPDLPTVLAMADAALPWATRDTDAHRRGAAGTGTALSPQKGSADRTLSATSADPILAPPIPTATAAPPAQDYVWEGVVALACDGTYQLNVSASHAAELWLDGELTAQGTTICTEATLSAGTHSLRLVCRQAGYDAWTAFSYVYTGPATPG